MNKKEKNRYDMLGAVADFGEKEDGSLAGVPMLVSTFSDLKMTYKEIGLNEGVLTEGTHGKVVSKDVSQEEIITTGLVFAGAIYGYAAGKNDSELMELSDLSSSDFKRLRDSEIPLIVEKYLDKAAAIGIDLAGYGITPELSTEARAKLTNYLNKFSGVREGKGVKKTSRETITLLFNKSEKQLKVLDKLMISFKQKNPKLYSRYEAARIIYDKGTSHNNDTDETNPPDDQPK